jgi:mRNA interferase RelE/StbE
LGYKVIIQSSAKKELGKLDKPIQKRLLQFLTELEKESDPRISGIAMQGIEKRWRYRVGDYRMIAEIEDQKITIHIFKIGHRREVYK